MKRRILNILLLSLVVVVCGMGKAQAITVDGFVDPTGEWDTYWIYGTDPDEGNIHDNYDIAALYAWWDDDWSADPGNAFAYIRTDVYGTPTLDSLDPQGTDGAHYEWRIDTNGDKTADLRLRLYEDDWGSLRVALYRMDSSGTYLGEGTGALGDVVEVSFDLALIPEDLRPTSNQDIGIWMVLDNDGDDPDDTMDWHQTIPEPTSALLLGIGLVGLAGRRIRKRFRA